MIVRLSLFHILALALALSSGLATAAPTNRPTPGYTRVAIETSVGTIIVAVDQKRAPRTAA